ncbi:hypothetical protein [Hymenobacter fodinae]|uniref:DUF3108 domain-containing protein n=1 Tax=Hymenobacter fodinae TaxID=2510796 RepID=A0A4Z0P0Z8_9BACT|nr:hypothetical protein [Hymenobacter fodinae]TGE04258.1 hypothetical protein EU556_23615 [Hymenobacter fodinae]
MALLSCQTGPSQLIGVGAKNSAEAKPEIFTQNKEFVYQVSRFKDGRAIITDTVVLTSIGTAWKMDTTQKEIGWSSKVSGTQSGTGVEESPSGVWIHPPRFDEYAILELSPFPEVRLPFSVGQEWDWELSVGSHWSNPAWAVWKDRMVVRSHYKAGGEKNIQTRLGQLTCYEVTAVATCTAGKTTLVLLFHPQYGFVELDYRNMDGKRMRFQLVSSGIINEFHGATYFDKPLP